jgi:hypothetical protein
MLTFIVCIVVCIVILISIIRLTGYGETEFIEYFMGVVYGTMLGLVVGFVIVLFLPTETYKYKYSVDIVSLQDNSNTKGTFFLGSGQINGSMKYVFYYESDTGLYRMCQIDYNLTEIKYTKEKPKVIITEYRKKDTFKNKFTIFSFHQPDNTYVIEVPEGTIKNNYNLDSQ